MILPTSDSSTRSNGGTNVEAVEIPDCITYDSCIHK